MNSKVLKRLFHYLKNYKGKFVISVVAALIGTLFTVIAPRLLGDVTTVLYAGITDHVWFIENLPDGTVNPASVWVQGPFMAIGKVQAVIWLVIALIVMYVLSFLFNSMANRMMARVASCVVKDLRSDIDNKMHSMKLNYHDTRTNGEILSVITNDVDAINTLLGKNLFQSITAVITLVGVLVMLLSINGWLALIAALMIPGTLMMSGPVMKRGAKSFAAQQNLLGDVNGYVEEMFNGQNVVSSFNYQDKAIEQFESLNEELRGTAEKAEKYLSKNNFTLSADSRQYTIIPTEIKHYLLSDKDLTEPVLETLQDGMTAEFSAASLTPEAMYTVLPSPDTDYLTSNTSNLDNSLRPESLAYKQHRLYIIFSDESGTYHVGYANPVFQNDGTLIHVNEQSLDYTRYGHLESETGRPDFEDLDTAYRAIETAHQPFADTLILSKYTRE